MAKKTSQWRTFWNITSTAPHQNGKNKFLKTTRKATNKTSCNSAAKKTFQKNTKTVVFTCDLPYTFSDIAKLPEAIQQHLQSVELKDTLKAEFGVSENNEAFYLKYLDAGAGFSFPKGGNAEKIAAPWRRCMPGK